MAPQIWENCAPKLAPHHQWPSRQNVWKISQLRGALSPLAFNKLLSNLATVIILRRSFQWRRWIFPNLYMSKVENTVERSIDFRGLFDAVLPQETRCVWWGPLGPSRSFQRMTWKNLVYSLSKSLTLLMNTRVSCWCQNLCSSCCLVLLSLLHYVIWLSHESETPRHCREKTLFRSYTIFFRLCECWAVFRQSMDCTLVK